MYLFIIALTLASTSKFSSKSSSKKKTLVPSAKEENKSKDKKEISENFKAEGFYYPLISFNEVKEKGNFFDLHFSGKKEIFPVSKGIVLFVGKENDLPGYTVVLYHSPGYVSLYSNLDEVKIIKGDLIKNIFEPLGVADKKLTFSFRRSLKDNTIEQIDIKKILKKRDNYNKT